MNERLTQYTVTVSMIKSQTELCRKQNFTSSPHKIGFRLRTVQLARQEPPGWETLNVDGEAQPAAIQISGVKQH